MPVTRRGVLSLIGQLMLAAIMFVIMIEMFGVVYYGSLVVEKTGQGTANFYTGAGTPIDVLGASCATRERGIFWRSAVDAGDFRCLAPQTTMTVAFDISDEPGDINQWWVLERTGEGVTVGKQGEPGPFDHRYRVLIYDAGEESYTPAILRVGS